MKITTKELNKKAYKYIVSCIDSESYDVKTTDTRSKLEFLYNTFTSEHGYENAQVGEYKSFTNWILGIPSALDIEFANYKIVELAKKWGSLDKNATESQEQKIIDNYWNFITVKTFQLFRKYKIIK